MAQAIETLRVIGAHLEALEMFAEILEADDRADRADTLRALAAPLRQIHETLADPILFKDRDG